MTTTGTRTTALTAALADWAASTTTADLPADVVHQCKRATLDVLGAIVAGSGTEPARIVQDHLAATEGPGPATVLGTALRCSAANAALANGTAAHALEVDDGYTPGSFHPGAPILSAVLAVAEAERATGDDVLRGTAVGYEVGCRLAQAGHPATWRRGFHNTAVVGVFGAAAAVTALLDGTTEDMAGALGLAGSHASGLFEFLADGSDVKRLHAGKAARDGVVCAQLSRRGLRGPATVLEGPQGYAAAYTGGELDPGVLLDGLGSDWRMLRTYVKPYPCCRHLHGPIDAVLALRAEGPVAVDDVERVEVETFATAARHGGHRSDTLLDAQMSIPYAVAVALRDGEVGLAQFAPEVRRDPEVQRLARRVTVRVADDCDRDYPAMRPARVRLVTRTGERALRVDQPSGEPSAPLGDDALEARFAMLCEGRADPDRVREAIAAVWAMDDPAALCRMFAGQPA